MAPALLLLLALLAFQDPTVSELIDRLRTNDGAARRKARRALLDRGGAAVEAAVRALGAETPDLEERVGTLVASLGSNRWQEREQATRTLAGLGRFAREALEKHRSAEDAEVAWRVRDALVVIEASAGREARLERLRDAALCEFLGEAGDGRGVAPLLRILSAHQSPEEVGWRAAEALGRLRRQLTEEQVDGAAHRVLAILAAGLPALEKARLVKALADLRSPVCVLPLAALVADRSEKDLNLKRGAMIALAATGEAAGFRAVIDALLSENPWLREAASAVLAEATGGEAVIDPRVGPDGNRAAIGRLRTWWEERFKRPWE